MNTPTDARWQPARSMADLINALEKLPVCAWEHANTGTGSTSLPCVNQTAVKLIAGKMREIQAGAGEPDAAPRAPEEGQHWHDHAAPAVRTARSVKRPEMRSVPCAIECRGDGKAVYACIGDPGKALQGESGLIAFGDTLADALRALAIEIEREVGWDAADGRTARAEEKK